MFEKYPHVTHRPGTSQVLPRLGSPPSFGISNDDCGEKVQPHKAAPNTSTMPLNPGKSLDIIFGIFLSSVFAYYLPQYINWFPDFSIWVFLLIVAANLSSLFA